MNLDNPVIMAPFPAIIFLLPTIGVQTLAK
jgi:hypothetical protein